MAVLMRRKGPTFPPMDTEVLNQRLVLARGRRAQYAYERAIQDPVPSGRELEAHGGPGAVWSVSGLCLFRHWSTAMCPLGHCSRVIP